jgi:T5SS/PEP-CTERM-associated repeat protein
MLRTFKLQVGARSGAQGVLTLGGGTLNSSSILSLGETLGSTGVLSITAGQLIATNDITKVGNLGPAQMTQSGGTSSFAFLSVGDNAPGSVSVNGGQLSVIPRTTNDWLRIGNFGRGEFNIRGGNVVLLSEFHIGDSAGVTGIVSVVGGQLFARNEITAIGRYGVGEMTISNATALLTNVSVGRHDGAIGTLTVQPNGSLFTVEDLSLARFANSIGHVLVSGGLLSLTNDNIWVGREGIGDLIVSNGTVRAKSMFVGMSPDNTNAPQGTVILAGGATQLSSDLVVGTSTLSTGQVIVAGGNLNIANSTNAGSLTVANGTFTLNQGDVTIDKLVLTNSTGQFAFNGGMLQAKSITAANGAPFVVGDGVNTATLQLQGGTYSFAGGLVVAPNASVTGCGTIIGSITNLGALATNCGPFITITAINKADTSVTVSFTTTTGANHVLEYKTDLDSTTWSAILPGVVGNGDVMSKTDSNAITPSRFYRIHVQ